MARRLTVDELWTLMRYGGSEFFSVEFERRTRDKRFGGTAQAGTIKTMLCRTGMSKYKQGIQSDAARDARDFRHGILTVWSMGAYRQNLQTMDKSRAAFQAWRSIDVVTVRSCSILNAIDLEDGILSELPPDILDGVHQMTNQFRLNSLPREPIVST